MRFTEYKFDPAYITALTEEKRAGLKANRGFSNLLGFGLGVVAERLQKDPRRYRDYGPWWWALKDLLRQAGYDVGNQSDPLVAQEYRFDMPEQTLIAADEFRSDYLKTTIVGSNQFILSAANPEAWVLFDADMESRP